MTTPRKVKSKKSQGKVRRPWAICTDCKKMKDKLAEKDALLREAIFYVEESEIDYVNFDMKQKCRDLSRRIRESLGGGNG